MATSTPKSDLHYHTVSPAVVSEALELIKLHTGIDFSTYSPAMVPRRLRNHMLALGVHDAEEYLSRLRGSPTVVRDALGKLAIKVSRFYRNPLVFDRLRDELLPALAAESPGRPLRIWCAGAGLGEESYTIAMLLSDLAIDGTVLVSDIDEKSLAAAEAGIYPDERRNEVPTSLQHCCEPTVELGYWRVAQHVRDRVHVIRHDLTGTTVLAGGQFDLVSCRNVLIYLNPAGQRCALRHLIGPLRTGGILLMGEAEWPTAEIQCGLSAIAPTLRLFRKESPVECVA